MSYAGVLKLLLCLVLIIGIASAGYYNDRQEFTTDEEFKSGNIKINKTSIYYNGTNITADLSCVDCPNSTTAQLQAIFDFFNGTGYPNNTKVNKSGDTLTGALSLVGTSDTWDSAEIKFNATNATGYGIIVWDSNRNDSYSWDVITQVHNSLYYDPTIRHDHYSMYVRNITGESFHAFNVPFNVSNEKISMDFQIPINISNGIGATGIGVNYIKDVRTRQTNDTGSLNAPYVETDDSGITTVSNSGGYGINLNTISGSATENVFLGFQGQRGTIGYNGTSGGLELSGSSDKDITIFTNDGGTKYQRVKIEDNGDINLTNTTLNANNATFSNINGSNADNLRRFSSSVWLGTPTAGDNITVRMSKNGTLQQLMLFSETSGNVAVEIYKNTCGQQATAANIWSNISLVSTNYTVNSSVSGLTFVRNDCFKAHINNSVAVTATEVNLDLDYIAS